MLNFEFIIVLLNISNIEQTGRLLWNDNTGSVFTLRCHLCLLSCTLKMWISCRTRWTFSCVLTEAVLHVSLWKCFERFLQKRWCWQVTLGGRSGWWTAEPHRCEELKIRNTCDVRKNWRLRPLRDTDRSVSMCAMISHVRKKEWDPLSFGQQRNLDYFCIK